MTGARDPDKSAVGERECPSPPRRLARRLLVILIALLAVGWTAFFLYNHSGAARLAAARREAQALGLALSYDDFLAKYPPPLEEENAAQFYEAAIATLLYVGYKPESDYVPIVSRALAGEPEAVDERRARAIRDRRRLDSDPRIPMPDYMLEASAVYAANRAPVIDLVHKGAALPLPPPVGSFQYAPAAPHACSLDGAHDGRRGLGRRRTKPPPRRRGQDWRHARARRLDRGGLLMYFLPRGYGLRVDNPH